ncbi:MAG: hypothetical protein KF722_18615 [Nitrospira sp.]|nr:hypothetical protein [Nitrospira sp.]
MREIGRILTMKECRAVLSSLFLMLAMLSAGQSLPGFSRSGEVKDIAITSRLSVTVIQVTGGDEIHWTNRLRTPVRITFSNYVLDKLSCRSNFSRHFYSGADTDLQPNERAGLCFYKPGTTRYILRMDLGNGEIAESEQVQVEALSVRSSVQNKSVAGAPP